MFGFFVGIVSSAISAISTAMPAISSIASAACSLVCKLPQIIGPALDIAGKIGNLLFDIAKVFNAGLNTIDNVLTLGAKIFEANMKGIEMEPGESVEHYVDRIKDVQVDQESIERLSPEERLARVSLGCTTMAKHLEEKLDINFSPDFLAGIQKMDIKQNEVEGFIRSFKNEGVKSMDPMIDYLSGKEMSVDDINKIDKIMYSSLSSIYPHNTEGQNLQRIASMEEKAKQSW